MTYQNERSLSLGHAVRKVAPLLAASAIALAAALPGAAQTANDGAQLIIVPSITGETDRPEALPSVEGRSAAPRAQEREAQAASSGASAPLISPLRPIEERPVKQGLYRLEGESPASTFSLFVPDGAAPQMLLLAFRSSIHTLPDRSQMMIWVNGVQLDTVPLNRYEPDAPLRLIVPEGVMFPGRNEVRIEAQQYHRIYCGPQASFDLWTELDLAASGAVISGTITGPSPDGRGPGEVQVVARPRTGGASFLAAAAAMAANGRDPIPIRVVGDVPDSSRAMGEISAHLSRALGGPPPAFQIGEVWGLAQPRPAAARITIVQSDTTQVSFRRGGDGAEVFMVELAPDSTLPLDELFPIMQVTENVPALPTDTPVPLSELGFEGVATGQRYLLKHIRFTLPDDWLELTARKAEIRLDYGYAESLDEQAMLLINVNGKTVRLLPLRGEGGVMIDQFPILFNARLMKPGTNQISFEALIPGNPPDLACPDRTQTLLEIRPTTTLEVKSTPRMQQPDLSRAVALLGPDSPGGPDGGGLGLGPEAQLTLASALAGRTGGGAELMMLAPSDLGALPLGRYDVDRALFRDALFPKTDAERAEASRVAVQDLRDTTPLSGSAPVGSSFRPQDSAFSVSAHSERLAWLEETASTYWEDLQRLLSTAVPRPAQDLTDWLQGRHARAMLLQFDLNKPNTLWLIKGPEASYTEVATALSIASRSGTGPHGQIALLNADGTWTSWTDPGLRPQMREPVSIYNIQSVLGTYASWSPPLFVALILALASISAVFAIKFIISTRGDRL